ncbi:hypothetical protein [Streptomyces sp. NPDC057302]|uniref:hypothetical protein n=1 Tax=Streptomyces sp. NPDC057302 TaxID=3346094 RepID=UPI00362DA6C5
MGTHAPGPHRLRKAAVRACCVALLVAVTGCGFGGPAEVRDADAGAGAGTGAGAPRVDARQLLLDSWVSDGKRGYFVDGARSTAASPFSLYETTWRLRTAKLAGSRGVHVQPDRMRPWASAAEQGLLESSGLPAIAQIDFAVEAQLAAGGSPGRARVARALEGLRSGDGYRTAGTAKAADPGSTAVAVRVLARLGLPVPAPVRTRAADRLASLTPAGVTRDPGAAISLLQTAGALGLAPPPRTAALAAAAQRALARRGMDAVRLASEDALRTAAGQLGVQLPAFDPASCAAAVRPDGGVALPGGTAGDPQATYLALRLGCAGAKAPAPGAHSRMGWPGKEARQGALGSSAAAMAVAGRTGYTEPFAAQLASQLREVWLPAASRRKAPYDTGQLAGRVNLRQLARTLGAPLVRTVDARLPALRAASIPAGDEARLLLSALDLGASARGRDRLCAPDSVLRTVKSPSAESSSGNGSSGKGSSGKNGSLTRAVRLAAVAGTCGDARLRQRAVRESGALRVGEGVYSSGRGASFESSVAGVWITRPGTDAEAAWRRAGLCAGDRCAESGEQLEVADHTPLRTLAVLLAVRAGAYDELFPIAF